MSSRASILLPASCTGARPIMFGVSPERASSPGLCQPQDMAVLGTMCSCITTPFTAVPESVARISLSCRTGCLSKQLERTILFLDSSYRNLFPCLCYASVLVRITESGSRCCLLVIKKNTKMNAMLFNNFNSFIVDEYSF